MSPPPPTGILTSPVFRVRLPRRLGLKGRAAALLAAGILSGALLTGLFFFDLDQVTNAYREADLARQSQIDNDLLRLAMTQQQAALRGFLTSSQSSFADAYLAARADTDAAIARLRGEITGPEGQVDLDNVQSAAAAWEAWADRERVSIGQGGSPMDGRVALEGEGIFSRFSAADAVLAGTLDRDAKSSLETASAGTTVAIVSVVLGATTGAIVILLLGRILFRQALDPLVKLVGAAQAMAGGKIVRVPQTERQDEVGQLARALVEWDRTARKEIVMARRIAETEHQYQHLFSRAPIGIARCGLDCRIQEANQALLDMLGLARDRVVGSSLLDLVDDEPAARAACARIKEERSEHETFEGRRVLPVGGVRWLHVSASALPEIGGTRPVALVAMVEDVTDAHRVLDRLQAINRVGLKILEARPTAEVNAEIARNARELVSADLAAVALVDEDGDLRVEAATGRHAAQLRGIRVPVDGSLSGRALREGRTLVTGDMLGDPAGRGDILQLPDTGPAVLSPIAHGDSRFGVLIAMNARGGRAFVPADVELLDTFARQAAIAFEYARVQERVRELRVIEERERIGRDLQDSVIQSLFGIGLSLQAATMLAGEGGLAARLEAAEAELDLTIRRMRNLVFGLHPDLHADRHLDMALRQLADEFTLSSGVEVQTDVDAAVAAELSPAAPVLIDVVRRALAPTGSFSTGAEVRLSLRRTDGAALLEIGSSRRARDLSQDDLKALREVTAPLDGQVEVTGGDGPALQLQVRVPLGGGG